MSSQNNQPASDKQLYFELNSHSDNMRKAALDLATQLEFSPTKSREIVLLIQSLNAIATSDIETMDSALNNFKKCMASITLKSNNEELFGDSIASEALPAILEKYAVFIKSTIALAEKAIQLSHTDGS